MILVLVKNAFQSIWNAVFVDTEMKKIRPPLPTSLDFGIGHYCQCRSCRQKTVQLNPNEHVEIKLGSLVWCRFVQRITTVLMTVETEISSFLTCGL